MRISPKTLAMAAGLALATTAGLSAGQASDRDEYVVQQSRGAPTVSLGGTVVPIAWLLIRVTWLLILMHVVEITVWALFYWWQGCLPDAEAGFYCAGVTSTTIGFGDLVLAKPWRILGPVEGLTGILMCGLSAGLFLGLVTLIYSSRLSPKPNTP